MDKSLLVLIVHYLLYDLSDDLNPHSFAELRLQLDALLLCFNL